ncbi:Exocyst complex component Sec5 [Purpureocillium lavendulum]|uniref:Exocyst complex component Sec5 n=1 Tax=Purpureocillium lavendulum TaxID=1247861 RepID=A0AB34FZF1_9HYPO|nr:Exocyst complex component Sec5 [Purpureocillium lavendulum]
MKFSTLFAGAFAALAAAAPAPAPGPDADTTGLEARRKFDAGNLNNLIFKQQDLNYLLSINSLDLGLFQTLGINNNLNLLLFQDLFNVQVFDINSLVRFAQLQTLLAISSTGVFNAFDLSTLNLGSVNFGLIGGVGGVQLGQFIDAGAIPQIGAIAGGGESNRAYSAHVICGARLLTLQNSQNANHLEVSSFQLCQPKLTERLRSRGSDVAPGKA